MTDQGNSKGRGFPELIASVPEMHRALAIEYGVALSTVTRWAKGITAPLPRMQRVISAWLAAPRIGDVLESKDGKRRTVVSIDHGRFVVRTERGIGTIYPHRLHLYRVVRS